jgi:hypothetical protein
MALPRRQKSAPTSPSIGDRVSAALTSRDEGDQPFDDDEVKSNKT